jgi:hypothetical protein
VRSAHDAPRLTFVTAIAKPALQRQSAEVFEIGVTALAWLPQLQSTHARSVDDRATLRTHKKLTMRRLMATADIVRLHTSLGGLTPDAFVAQITSARKIA